MEKKMMYALVAVVVIIVVVVAVAGAYVLMNSGGGGGGGDTYTVANATSLQYNAEVTYQGATPTLFNGRRRMWALRTWCCGSTF